MPDLDITTDLRAGADNIHSIGPVQAATLLRAAAETIDALRRDFAEARQLASRYGIELGPHLAAHGEHARAANQRGTNIPYLGTEPLVERRLDPEARRRLDNVTSKEAHRLLGLDKVQPHILGAQGRISVGGDPEAIASLGLAEERGCHPGSCAASPRCRNRAEMRANHGTPEQFIAAISRAAGEMTVAEADRAVARYCDAWEAATEPTTSTPPPPSDQTPRFEGFVPPAERSSTMARIERWKKRQPTTPGAETYDFTPEQEAEAAEQAERFQGLDDSDRD